MRRRKQQSGSAAVEFAFTGVPLIFIWIGIFWMSFGMWQYHTLQYASKTAAAYLAVHGSLYVAQAGSSIEVKDVATVMARHAVGIPASQITATFTAGSSNTVTCVLSTCETNATVWPPTTANTVGTDITVKGVYTFIAPFGMWVPGHGSVAFANSYALPGYSHQQILF